MRRRFQRLIPIDRPPDAFVVRGAGVYLHLPNGVARTKLSNAWFDSKLDDDQQLEELANGHQTSGNDGRVSLLL